MKTLSRIRRSMSAIKNHQDVAYERWLTEGLSPDDSWSTWELNCRLEANRLEAQSDRHIFS